MNHLLLDISQIYTSLILSKAEGLTVYVLAKRVEHKEIPKHFTHRDIEQAIKEATVSELGGQPQTEKVIRTLLPYFIERPPRKQDAYMLTDYAYKFVKLINHKLNNPYKKFPLRKTFDSFANFKAEDIHSLNDFSRWYELQFHETSRQTVLDHLEALKDEVNSSIQQLNEILKNDSENATEMVGSFTEVFNSITAKSEEIRDTLRLGSTFEQEIDSVVDSFYIRLDTMGIPKDIKGDKKLTQLRDEYQETQRIKQSVNDFFQSVNDRLNLLTVKVLYASTQLKSLQNNFRNHSRFRLNIKKFLHFTLKEARFSKNGPKLPNAFPLKEIPSEKFRFIHVPYYEVFGSTPNYVITPQQNEVYAKQEREKVIVELTKQEITARLVEHYKELISKEPELDFTDHFYQILAKEDDIEIAMNVCFEVFQFANSQPGYEVNIQRELPLSVINQKLITWNMKIIQKQMPAASLNS